MFTTSFFIRWIIPGLICAGFPGFLLLGILHSLNNVPGILSAVGSGIALIMIYEFLQQKKLKEKILYFFRCKINTFPVEGNISKIAMKHPMNAQIGDFEYTLKIGVRLE